MYLRTIPSLSALRAFEAMARLGGFSVAARELNVTPSGNALSKALQEGFQTIACGIRTVRADDEAQPLQITLTPAFAENWLMPRSGSFWAEHLEIELLLNPSTRSMDLAAGGIDLAIQFELGVWPGLQAEKLVGAGHCIISHPDLMRRLTVKSLKDMLSAPWLLERQFTGPEHILELQGLDLAQSAITRIATNALVLAVARAGLGLAIQPKSLVNADIAEGRLVCIKASKANSPTIILSDPGLRTLKTWQPLLPG